MPSTTTKWIIGIAFGLFGCLVLSVFLWWHSSGSALFHGVADNMLEGRRLGKSMTATVCVDTAIARQSAAIAVQKAKGDSTKPDIAALMAPSLVLQGCLSVAQGGDELCQNVPLQNKDRQATEAWASDECRRRQAGSRDCAPIMAGVQVYCARRIRTS